MLSSEKMFESILDLSKISKVYFIDDYLPSAFDVDKVMAVTEDLLKKNGEEPVVESLNKIIDLGKIPPSEITNTLRRFCETKEEDVCKEISKIVFGLSDSEFLKQSELTSKIVELFPGEKAEGVHPTKWDGKLADLQNASEKGQVLLLLDQDLSKATGFETRTGIQLIRELKKKTFFDKLTCVLISNDIEETSNELTFRDTILKEQTDLQVSDFFPLSKKRIYVDDHFYDGIKKSLLNAHCEKIKSESSEIFKEAYKKTLDRIKDINTYDFDHTIFQSSYEEGVWEAETLFRIAEIILDEEIKKEIIAKQFQKKVNGITRESKRLSDFRFSIDSKLGEPYTEKFKLRHSEIYEAASIINKMHKPIENGDIFEIYDGNESYKGTYILIGQECDLMIRNPDGKREASLGFLFRITIDEYDVFIGKIRDHYKEHNSDFFDSKFKLEYFESGTDKVGLVSLKNPLVVHLSLLDLVVFNQEGVATIDVTKDFDTSVLSFAWEACYKRVHADLKSKTGEINSTWTALKQIGDQNIKAALIAKNRPRLSPVKPEAGKEITIQKNTYEFGIKRILNFRRSGSSILLDKFSKYQSRHATLHDFAELKVIKVEEQQAEANSPPS